MRTYQPWPSVFCAGWCRRRPIAPEPGSTRSGAPLTFCMSVSGGRDAPCRCGGGWWPRGLEFRGAGGIVGGRGGVAAPTSPGLAAGRPGVGNGRAGAVGAPTRAGEYACGCGARVCCVRPEGLHLRCCPGASWRARFLVPRRLYPNIAVTGLIWLCTGPRPPPSPGISYYRIDCKLACGELRHAVSHEESLRISKTPPRLGLELTARTPARALDRLAVALRWSTRGLLCGRVCHRQRPGKSGSEQRAQTHPECVCRRASLVLQLVASRSVGPNSLASLNVAETTN